MSVRQLRDLFDGLVDLDESEQQAALSDLERTDPDAAKRLRNLLAADRESQTGDFVPDPDPWPLKDFGPFRIVKPLGGGGMGNVYLAEQSEPVRRQVALKVIRPGLLLRGMGERFAREQQALAALSHPLIAQFYDAGTTPEGSPYFAMEHVDGETIDRYCTAHKLSLRHRLQLFRQVCVAVHYAHTKGMIHRDLKPPNILVSRLVRQPVVKVIDFGIAKFFAEDPDGEPAPAMSGEQAVSEASMHRLLGTPDYMSPEQFAATSGSTTVDTRTDVYALGIILYKLLTGRTPHQFAQRNLPLGEVSEALAGSSPARPSDALLEDGAVELAASMGENGASLRGLRKIYLDELDWIVLKATDPDPDRRYQSAEALGDDLRRFLSDRVVEARPPSGWYRFKKLMARHKTATAVLIMVILAEIGIAVTWTIQARKIEAEAKNVEQALTLLTETFSAAFPAVSHSEPMNAGEVLDRAAQSVSNFDASHPARLRVLKEIGEISTHLGETSQAIDILEKVYQGYREANGPESEAALEAQVMLGTAYRTGSRLEDAETTLSDALDRARDSLGPRHRITLRALGSLANVYQQRVEPDRALPLLEEGYQSSREALGPEDSTTLIFAAGLALSYSNQSQYRRAIDLLELTLPALARERGENHISVLGLTMNVAFWYDQIGEQDRSGEILDDILPRMDSVLGPDHPVTLSAMENRVLLDAKSGDFASAVERQRALYEIRSQVHGPQHVESLRAQYQWVRYRMFAREAPEPVARDFALVIEDLRSLLGDDSALTRHAVVDFAQALDEAGDEQGAFERLRWARAHGFSDEEAENTRWLTDLWTRSLTNESGANSRLDQAGGDESPR